MTIDEALNLIKSFQRAENVFQLVNSESRSYAISVTVSGNYIINVTAQEAYELARKRRDEAFHAIPLPLRKEIGL